MYTTYIDEHETNAATRFFKYGISDQKKFVVLNILWTSMLYGSVLKIVSEKSTNVQVLLLWLL